MTWFLALQLLLPPIPEAPQPERIVVVVADDLGEQSLAEAQTPNIDSLGWRATTFYGSPNCAPSRGKLLTGRRPLPSFQIGTNIRPQGQSVPEFPSGIPDEHNPALPHWPMTVAEMAQTRGYTPILLGKWALTNDTDPPVETGPLRHGFQVARAVSLFGVGPGYGGGTEGNQAWRRYDDGVLSLETTYNTQAIADEAVTLLAAGGKALVWVSFNAPHFPYHTPPGYSGLRTDREKYLAMVEAMDFHIGRILAQLGPDDLLIFLSDNGTPGGVEGVGEAPKGSVLDGGVPLPLRATGSGG